jgi:hypothetical protein
LWIAEHLQARPPQHAQKRHAGRATAQRDGNPAELRVRYRMADALPVVGQRLRAQGDSDQRRDDARSVQQPDGARLPFCGGQVLGGVGRGHHFAL